tara:strand:- start:13647 stop:13880 length:234 start_codon:yes stop_codon:yes gene_type:complete
MKEDNPIRENSWRVELDRYCEGVSYHDSLKDAIYDLIEVCEHQSEKTGDSAADIFWNDCISIKEMKLEPTKVEEERL